MDHFCWDWWPRSAGFCMSSSICSSCPCLMVLKALKLLFMFPPPPEMPLLFSVNSAFSKVWSKDLWGVCIWKHSVRTATIRHRYLVLIPLLGACRVLLSPCPQVTGRAETWTRPIRYRPLHPLYILRTSIHTNTVRFQNWHPGDISGRTVVLSKMLKGLTKWKVTVTVGWIPNIALYVQNGTINACIVNWRSKNTHRIWDYSRGKGWEKCFALPTLWF